MFAHQAMLAVTWIMLAGWIVAPLIAVSLPTRQHDPHRGVAVGLLIAFAMIGGALAVGFAAGLYWDLWLLVRVPMVICGFLAVLVGVNGARWLFTVSMGR